MVLLRAARVRPRRSVDVSLTDDHPARALHSPFVLPDSWSPILGHCSRCGGDALLAEDRWWHDGPSCRANGPTAEFVPDPPE